MHVAEYIPEVVTWNRDLLGPESKAALEDPRVTVLVADVFKVIKRSDTPLDRYDAILLDVDNGPVAMVASGNRRLYDRRGIASIARALRPRGRIAIWSADQDDPFSARLVQEGFIVTPFDAKPHDRAKRAAHRIYLARTPRLEKAHPFIQLTGACKLTDSVERPSSQRSRAAIGCWTFASLTGYFFSASLFPGFATGALNCFTGMNFEGSQLGVLFAPSGAGCLPPGVRGWALFIRFCMSSTVSAEAKPG